MSHLICVNDVRPASALRQVKLTAAASAYEIAIMLKRNTNLDFFPVVNRHAIGRCA
jgi:hypothetical protein